MRSARDRGEPTLPLINIVFLMLIFFLVTAQTARPLDPSMELVETDDEALV
ncbi:MAG: biopolymer transporter ExbD, partial [Pseudomonadota bacterium]